MARVIEKDNQFANRLLKILPSESVTAYLALINLVPPDKPANVFLFYLIFAIVITLITPFYLIIVMKMDLKKDLVQLIFITLSFIVWVFTLNGEIFIPAISSFVFIKTAVLIIWTLLMPMVNRGQESDQPS